MGEKTLNRKMRKALSPIIATLLLVSISIAGVLIVYRFMNSVVTSSSNVLGLQVLDKQLKVFDDGTAAFYISAKNIGNIDLYVTEIVIGNYTETLATPERVMPGETFTYNTIISNVGFKIGQEYPLIIKVKMPDDSIKVFQEVIRGE